MVDRIWFRILAGIAVCSLSLSAQAVDITGAGASFPFPVYAKWAARYHAETGHRVNYQSIGSGGGQQQIIARTVDFGASDDPMSASALAAHGLLQFPAVVGGTVPVVNIDGVQPGELRLTGPVLADIFLGIITRWNDDAIAELNADVDLPDSAIVVVHRSDGSGTTFIWTNYLSQVSPQWKQSVGEGKAVRWPVGQGGKGNEGVAAYVRQLKNSIGYVEYAYASQNNLAWTQLQNSEGNFVSPGLDSFSASAAHADWKAAPGMGAVLNNQPGPDSWPITAASFILMHEVQAKPALAKEVLTFFDWAFTNAGDIAADMDYVPLPDTVTELINTLWKTEIKAADQTSVWE